MSVNLSYEPAAVVAFLKAVIYCLAVFGFNFSPEQMLALGSVVETGSVIFIRSKTATKAYVQDQVEEATE